MASFFLDFIQGERAGSEQEFDDEVVKVGRSEDCQLAFDEMGVSWAHAEIRRRDGDYWIIDQGSTNGTYVNDERAHNARLKDGDVLKFGKKGPVMRIRIPDAKRESGVIPVVTPEPDAEPVLAPAAAAAPVAAAAPRRHRAVTARQSGRVPSSAALPALDARSDLPPAAAAAGEPAGWSTGVVIALVVLLAASIGVAGLFFLDARGVDQRVADAEDRARAAEEDLKATEAGIADAVAEAREEGRRAAHEAAASEADRLRRELDSARRRMDAETSRLEAELEARERRIDGLENQLDLVAGPRTDWKEIADRLDPSVVFIATRLEGVKEDGERVPLHCFGTGFFVSEQGHVVTNKHVVQPWKFREMAERLVREGISVDESSYQVLAWTGSTRFLRRGRDGRPKLDVSTGFSTSNDTLEVLRTAPDDWETLNLDHDEHTRAMQVHSGNGNSDIAILKASGPRLRGVKAIPAGRGSRVEKLDEVMVLGFPAGPAILERGRAETSPSIGEVRKVESTIWVAAPMMGGNSGGPLLDDEGHVVGIATRVVNGSGNVGSCLLIEHALELLHRGPW